MSEKQYSVKNIFIISLLVSVLLTLLIGLLGGRLEQFPRLPDQGSWWYFWKLPAPELWARVTSWTGYALHQVAVWVLFFFALKEKRHPNYANKLNIIALCVNLFFIFLHLLQTHVFYDGLAQDVPTWTSQWSVIVMLGFVLVMLMPRRGLLLGLWKTPPRTLLGFLRKFHGFYISWALVYTFWFHPMEGNWGMLTGFLYMFFLMTQLSLFNTKLHFDIRWISFLEFFVVVHGVAITVYKNTGNWPMFLFGFLFMFGFTQIYGLVKQKKFAYSVSLAYIAITVLVFALTVGMDQIYRVTFIPGGLYGMALFVIVLFLPIEWVKRRMR